MEWSELRIVVGSKMTFLANFQKVWPVLGTLDFELEQNKRFIPGSIFSEFSDSGNHFLLNSWKVIGILAPILGILRFFEKFWPGVNFWLGP